MSSTGRTAFLGAGIAVAAMLGFSSPGSAETCWNYVDNPAKVPLRCVQKNNLSTACSWPQDCTVVAAPAGSQTILEMHRIWHECFGSTGGSNPPPGRGQRWYAFHRQFEYDYDLWRWANTSFGAIEPIDWCPGMDLQFGIFPSGPAVVSPGMPAFVCSTLPPRPDHVSCPECVAFAQCLFLPGAGPMGCTPPPGCSTPDPAVTLPYASLDQFHNVDEVALILDAEFHGLMHGAVADADNPGAYNDDNAGQTCSPRDGMFWRLHKALDDVVRAWQNVKAVDVVVVVDRSGSMSDPDSSGSTKLQAALTAVDNFADLLEDNRTDGQVNRIGLVSFSNGVSTDMPMTNAGPTLRAPGGPLETGIANITSAGASGCTGMGAGIQRAIELLCPPGDCAGFSGPGNARKAILLLTDGIENVPPCIQPGGASGGTCGNQCFGAQIDYAKLQFTQLVAVGFGNAASLDGGKLTLLAERQSGIYVQNPVLPAHDLKQFFTKAFGRVTDEFTMMDPTGTIAANDAASDTVEYSSCGDSKLTFASGWLEPVATGALRLQVRAPNGSVVLPGAPGVEQSRDHTWDFERVKLPQAAPVSGKWSAQIIRPHRVYVNGFTPDSFADPGEGIRLVRDEIHRLCPDGCKRVLAFEFGRRGPVSAYEKAIAAERSARLLSDVKMTTDPGDFSQALDKERWDLIVYAYMGPEKQQPYDQRLSGLICQNQRAILTDTRADAGGPAILRCGGAMRDGSTNWPVFEGDGKLYSGAIELKNPGYPVFSYGLRPSSAQSLVQATTPGGKSPAITAIVAAGKDARWYMDVLGSGLSRLDLHNRNIDQRAGEELFATVRMLPSFVPQGGFDKVDARVEVEFPRIGLGTQLARAKGETRRVNGEVLTARMDAASKLTIPTGKAVFPLYDDGTHGDLTPNNAVWTAALHGIGATDGTYTLHFIFDVTKNGCTTHRELLSSMYVDVRPDPGSSKLQIVSQAAAPGGGWRTVVELTPADRLGNLWGPGRLDSRGCDPADACRIDPESIVDSGTGTYRFAVDTPAATAGIRLLVAGGSYDLARPCPNCPRLTALQVGASRPYEHSASKATVRLDKAAPKEGTLVFLASSNALAASVPPNVRVPAGSDQATFDITLHHAHDGPAVARITAMYCSTETGANVTVLPLAWKESKAGQAATPHPMHQHYPTQQPPEPKKPPGE